MEPQNYKENQKLGYLKPQIQKNRHKVTDLSNPLKKTRKTRSKCEKKANEKQNTTQQICVRCQALTNHSKSTVSSQYRNNSGWHELTFECQQCETCGKQSLTKNDQENIKRKLKEFKNG